jgi:hypothetical protein
MVIQLWLEINQSLDSFFRVVYGATSKRDYERHFSPRGSCAGDLGLCIDDCSGLETRRFTSRELTRRID